MPRSKRSKKVTPARVKNATRQILSDARMLARVRAVEARNRSVAFNDAKSVPVTSGEFTRLVKGSASATEMKITRSSQGHGAGLRFIGGAGLSDLRNFGFSAQVATIYVGNGSIGTSGRLYWSTVGISSKLPIMPDDSAIFGVTWMRDIMQYFKRKKYKKLRLVIEPYANAVSTSTQIGVVIAPIRGGMDIYPTSAAALTPLGVSAVRSCKGASDFPVWQGAVVDLMPFVDGPGGGKEFTIERGAVSNGVGTSNYVANAQSTPCSVLIDGVASAVADAGTTVALATIEGELDLMDFNAFAAANPGVGPDPLGRTKDGLGRPTWLSEPAGWTGRPVERPAYCSDEKALPPRSVLADRGLKPSSESDSHGWVDAALTAHPAYVRRPPPIELGETPRDGVRATSQPPPNDRRAA